MTLTGNVISQTVITDKMIDDVLVTAFEGGINYWCSKVEVAEKNYVGMASGAISKNCTLFLIEDRSEEGEPDERHLLDRETMISGFRQAIVKFPRLLEELNDYENMAGVIIDAEMADCIVQLALFDEIIYG
jgi:hypothetical protein